MILVTGMEPVGKINGHDIYKITSTYFLSFNARNEYNYSQQQKSPATPVQKFVNQGLFYFSFDYHLTHTLQRQHTMAAELASKVQVLNAALIRSVLNYRAANMERCR